MINRQTVVFVFLTSIFVSCGGGGTTSENSDAETPVDQPSESWAVTSGKYKIKSGIVQFDVEAMGTKVKKMVYFDDFGSKERVEDYNPDGTVREMRISDGKKRYTLSPADKTAYFSDENGRLGWEMEFVTWEKIQGQDGYEKNYSKAPNMTVVNKDCTSFKYGDKNTFAGWNGILLYHEQLPIFKAIAISLEENVTLEADKFTVPSDYTLAGM